MDLFRTIVNGERVSFVLFVSDTVVSVIVNLILFTLRYKLQLSLALSVKMLIDRALLKKISRFLIVSWNVIVMEN